MLRFTHTDSLCALLIKLLAFGSGGYAARFQPVQTSVEYYSLSLLAALIISILGQAAYTNTNTI
jgi:hypothetical protein